MVSLGKHESKGEHFVKDVPEMQYKATPLAALSLGVVVLTIFAAQTIVAADANSHDTSAKSPEINTTLMETTFMVTGPSSHAGEENLRRFGTAFVMFRQVKADSNDGIRVLISARHVFDDIKGDYATVILRRRLSSGTIQPFPAQLKIRDGGKNLYVVHPTADVAAIDIGLPNDTIAAQLGGNITNIGWLATDHFLEQIGLHPGDELTCLGYPLGLAANDAGYPVLRGGQISSYPIIPLKESRLLYGFAVQPGNSGGPVYFSYTGRIAKDHLPNFGTMMTYQKVVGLVTQKIDSVGNIDPQLSIIVPSVYIKETIDLLAGFESKVEEIYN
jgi:hypothetical protein